MTERGEQPWAEFLLLGTVSVIVVVAVGGFWWRRYPRRAWVIATEGGWWFGGMVAGYAAVERLTAGMPPWVATAGILANLMLWLGVLGPVATRRFDRRFPLRGGVRPASRTEP